MYTVTYIKKGSRKFRNKNLPTLKKARAWIRNRIDNLNKAFLSNPKGRYLNVI